MTYALTNEWQKARERLAGLEAIADPETIQVLLGTVGVEKGWSCLELGAGAGSITRWLARRVGDSGRVVAVDLDTRFAPDYAAGNVHVVQSDVARFDFPRSSFDLVHARALLIHIPERVALVEKAVQALKPGGWLVLEEPDLSTNTAEPSVSPDRQRLHARVIQRTHAVMERRGVALDFGSELYGLYQRLGLTDITARRYSHIIRGGSRASAFFQLTYEQLGPAVTAKEDVSRAEFDAFLALCDDEAFAWYSPRTTSIGGRCPRPGW